MRLPLEFAGRTLAALIAIQIALYAVLVALSREFEYHTSGVDRPLVGVLILFGILFASYIVSLPLALQLANDRRWMIGIVLTAILFRGLVLFSEPIQEVDLYRYIWDGAVADQGISPYRFRPAEIRAAIENGDQQDDPLLRVARLADEHDGLRRVLDRVHFPELPTVYPPVSQVVFRAVHQITPSQATARTRIWSMKLTLVIFDIGVIGLLMLLLGQTGQNRGWLVAYAWSPLVIKEFANSGHLDSIAVFLTIGSMVALVAANRPRLPDEPSETRHTPAERTPTGTILLICAAVLAGLAVGAKLYPIVLFPLFAVYVWRQLGMPSAFLWAALAIVVAIGSLAPMIFADRSNESIEGLTAFITRWEMNDLLFMIVEENIRPEGSVSGQPPLWFAITPDPWRIQTIKTASEWFAGDWERTPFLLTRVLTTIVFLAIVLWFCRKVWDNSDRMTELAFLTLAWFWLLSPTQNPWYWTWALPLVPFARNRLWLSVSGLALIYYARFWFEYHPDVVARWGTAYQGVQFYDFIVVWFVFAPLLIALAYQRFATIRKS